MVKYRSKLERRLGRGVLKRADYEPFKLEYPKGIGKYTPDFVLRNGIIIEVKGYFKPLDRTKMKSVKAAHPGLDIRFIFQRAGNTLSKTSKTTYGEWCTRFGFKWCEERDIGLIERWSKEKR